jgi:hypothetical protein
VTSATLNDNIVTQDLGSCHLKNRKFSKSPPFFSLPLRKKSRQKHQQRKIDPEYRARRNAIARKSKALNPRSYMRRRGEWLKYKHNMTLEDYDILLKSQNGVCAICLQECKTKKGLAIDHNHSCCPVDRSCGKCIRGLLCSNCNRAIGMLQEDVVILNRAIAYLTSPQK